MAPRKTITPEEAAEADPLFDDAEESGKRERHGYQGYQWRKALGTECSGCGDPIEGRRWEVAGTRRESRMATDDGPARLVFDPIQWFHVRCVEPDMWHEWLGGASRSGHARRSDPKLGTKWWAKRLAEAVEVPGFQFDPVPTFGFTTEGERLAEAMGSDDPIGLFSQEAPAP